MSEKNVLSQEEIDALLNVPEESFIFSQDLVEVSIELLRVQLPLNKIQQLMTNNTFELNMCLGESINIIADGKVLAKGKIKLGNNNKFFLELY